jgi:hypothetical protein
MWLDEKQLHEFINDFTANCTDNHFLGKLLRFIVTNL